MGRALLRVNDMNKSELIEVVADRGRMTKKKAEDVVNLIFDSMVDAMKDGSRIEIRGFGSFVVKEYGSYTGRNPRTGKSIDVNPKKLPFFKVGKELKERVDTSRTKPEAEEVTPSEMTPTGGIEGSNQ